MSRLLHSIQAKLSLTLIVLIMTNSGFFVVIAIITTRTHMQAVEQSVNRGLAERILSGGWLAEGRSESAAKAFDRLMAVNPDIEAYRLDAAGRILDYSAPEGHVVRERVSVAPIAAFLSGDGIFPILGDDPRSSDGSKVFSAAAIDGNGQRAGYLYVVLGGEAYESVVRMLRADYALRLGLGWVAGGFVLVILIGGAIFQLLTKRFRRLTTEMKAFRESDFRRIPHEGSWESGTVSDEIDDAGRTFREMCNRIRDQIAMLEDADRSRRDMVAGISHDLRTPLATLRGYLETLLLKEDALSAATKHRYLELSVDYGERLSRLIDELFELSTLDRPDAKLELMPFSIAELAQDVREKWALEAERRGIRLITEISPATPFTVGDIALIERVFEKLLENALRFTPSGGTVRLEVAGGEDGVVARVEDSGPGILSEDLPHVFDRFYRGDRARVDTGGGAGLGLFIARRIVDLHGGTIGIRQAKSGASFFFTLPVARGW